MRISVVGLGKAGARHAAAVEALPGHTIAAVADESPEARHRFEGREFPVVASLEEALAIDSDVVVVALPHASLASAAERVVARGLHVLVEKPMAAGVDEGERLVSAARAAGVCLMVNYNHRFRDEYRTAKRWIREGRIGEPRFVSEQMFAPAGPLPAWVWQPSVARGGMMTYNGAHMVDHVQWLMDSPIAEARALVASLHYDATLEDTTAAAVRFESGALGSLAQSKSGVEHEVRWDTQVVGSEAALHIVSGRGATLTGAGVHETVDSGPDRRFEAAVEELVAAATEGREPSPGGADGLRALQGLEKIYGDCARSGP